MQIQNHPAHLCRFLVNLEVDRPADHHGSHFGGTGGLHIDHPDQLSATDDRTAVSDRLDLIELVRYENDRLAFSYQITHDLHQILDLLGSEDGRRFVEYENLGITIEHFQDLNPLLHSHRDILDDHIRINIQPVLLGEGLDLLGCTLAVEEELSFLSKNDIFRNSEVVNQLEVLVHHADAQIIGIVGAMDMNFLSPNQYFSLVCMVQTKEDAHQGGLSCPVLA